MELQEVDRTRLCVGKASFERWLIGEAEKVGAELHRSHKVKSAVKEFNSENQFSNWIIEGKGEQFPIKAKAIIDASGVAGFSAKYFGIGGEVEVLLASSRNA